MFWTSRKRIWDPLARYGWVFSGGYLLFTGKQQENHGPYFETLIWCAQRSRNQPNHGHTASFSLCAGFPFSAMGEKDLFSRDDQPKNEMAVGQNRFGTILGQVHHPLLSILVGIGMFTGGTGF